MFFATTLGPALTQYDGRQLDMRLSARRDAKGALDLADMRAIVGDYLRERGIKANVDAVIAQLHQTGQTLLPP